MIKAVKIPRERMAVLIGKSGSAKRRIERMTHTEITIGEDIVIKGEALDVLAAESIVRAIGRGFSPSSAEELAEEGMALDVVELPSDERQRRRVASRIIGTAGKSRRNIELLTKTRISVYGKSVSIIGRYDRAERARRAIAMLIKGYTHKAVYRFLERK